MFLICNIALSNDMKILLFQFQCTVCPPYRRYFTGYNNSLNDRESLKSNEEFIIFLKVSLVFYC